jgi:hypothetical protein
MQGLAIHSGVLYGQLISTPWVWENHELTNAGIIDTSMEMFM